MTHPVFGLQDLTRLILPYLYPSECIKLECIGKQWHSLINSPLFWKVLSQVQKISIDTAQSLASIKRQACLLQGEARLVEPPELNHEIPVIEQGRKIANVLCAKIEMTPVSKELSEKISNMKVIFFWIPIKYLYHPNKCVKRDGDTFMVKLYKRSVVLTIRDKKNTTSFDKELTAHIAVNYYSCFQHIKTAAKGLTARSMAEINLFEIA